MLALKQLAFVRNRPGARRANAERLRRAQPLALPRLERLELTVLAEQERAEGFAGEPGVSYLVTTDRGRLLFDVSFGPDRGVLAHNAERLGVSLADVDALAISHLHPDHMGGIKALRAKRVIVPEALGAPAGQPCYLPDRADAPGFSPEVVEGPRLLEAGLATTGPLARGLFFFGWTEEQALVARLRDEGLVVIVGCGHPTVPVLLEMVSRLSPLPVHALIGGLHFPVSHGRGSLLGIDVQTVMGTGKPPWRRITDDDLTETIATLNGAAPARLLLSAHDSCEHSLRRIAAETAAEVEVLQAGRRYRL